MIVLVIGPSGVGKSDYGKYAAGVIPGCHFFDLDKLVGQTAGILAGRKFGAPSSYADAQSCELLALEARLHDV